MPGVVSVNDPKFAACNYCASAKHEIRSNRAQNKLFEIHSMEIAS